MRILTADDIAQTGVKVLLHSNPGGGKTRLATSLPWGARWGEKAVFLPFDYKERDKIGVLAANHDRLIVVERDTPDPYSHLMDVLDRDWEREFGARTIIIDTFTNWTWELMTAAINSGAYASKVIQQGSRVLKMADKAHYGMVHNMTMNAITKIVQCPLNVIALFWSDWSEPQGVGDGAIFGGPVTVNMSRSKDVCGAFNNVFYLRTEPGKPPVYQVHTAPYGFWCAKLHGAHAVNPMPMVALKGDPKHFWDEFDAAMGASSGAPSNAPK